MPLQEARRQFDVNVFGLARLTQWVVPHMRAQRSGRIINISSVGGKSYSALGGWYHATRHAVDGFPASQLASPTPTAKSLFVDRTEGEKTLRRSARRG